MGLLFPENTKLYIYPTLKTEGKEKQMVNSKTIDIEDDIRMIYEYLIQNRRILDLNSELSEHMFVKSREVLKMIQEGNAEWERYVPMIVAKTIKEKKLFLK